MNGSTTPAVSIGRIVVYNHSGSADGKFPPKQSPAIVQKVNEDGTIECVVFSVGTGNGIFFANNVPQAIEGDPIKTSWAWPERV